MQSPTLARRALRVLKILVLTLLGVQLAYLVAANLLLRTGFLARLISRDPRTISLQYEGGWTVWFGRIHLRKLTVQGSSSTLDWFVEASNPSFDLRLRELVHRRIHASEVRGEGLVFRMRLRLTLDEADLPRALALPPIGPSPPLIEAGPPHELDDAHYNLWSTLLEDVDVGVREIWIQHYRYEGEARTRGGFQMTPQRRIEVPPSLLDVRSGAVTVGDHVVVEGLEGHLDCTLSPIDPRIVHGLHALSAVSGRVRLRGQTPGLGFVDFYLPPAAGVSLLDGSGDLQADLSLQGGEIGPASSFAYETDHLEVTSPEINTTLAGRFTLHTADDPGSPTATLTSYLPRATLQLHRQNVSPVLVEKATLELEEPRLRLVERPAQVSVKVDLPAVAMPDLVWLNPLLHSGGDGPKFTGGAAFLQARVEMDAEGRGSGRLGLRIKRGAFRWKDTTVEANGEGKVRIESADLLGEKVKIGKSHLELTDVLVSRKGDRWPEWWSTLDVEDAELGERLLGVTVDARCKNGQPAIEFLEAGGVLPEWAGALLRIQDLKVRARLEHRDHHLDFKLLRAHGDTIDVRGRLAKPDRARPLGAFLIKSGPLALGVDIQKDGTGLKPFEDDAWLDARIAALGR